MSFVIEKELKIRGTTLNGTTLLQQRPKNVCWVLGTFKFCGTAKQRDLLQRAQENSTRSLSGTGKKYYLGFSAYQFTEVNDWKTLQTVAHTSS